MVEQAETGIQPSGYLLELSLDWLVLRASQNMHKLLGHSHVGLIDEPLGKHVHSQALHDLRNLFSRLSGTTGIARAYRVRLTDDPDLSDVAFQVSDGRIVFEAIPSPQEGLGEAFSTVGGLIDGLGDSEGKALLEGGARRMRALTGYDRVTFIRGDQRTESSRGAFPAPAAASEGLPAILTDVQAEPAVIFPRDADETSAGAALLRAPDPATIETLRSGGVRALLCVPVTLEDGSRALFRCDSRTPRAPSFEVHAAAELFAQLFAMRLEIDRLKSRGGA